MKTLLRINIRTLTSCILLACSGLVAAQDSPLVFLTSHAAAGSSGKAASIITPRMEEYLNRPIELRHNQGASAGIGVPADGNTILMSTIGIMALHPVIDPNNDMDPLTDLRPVTRATATPDLLIVRSGLGINSLDELQAYSDENPGVLSYHYIAPMSIHRLEFAAILREFDIEATPDESLSFGPVQAIEAINGGTLDLLVATSPYMTPLIESGSAVALAVIHPTRMPLFPDVPTLLELGVTTMSTGSWAGIFAPAGTSAQDLKQIFEAVKFAMDDPSVIQQINDLGMEVGINESPAAFSAYIQAETDRLQTAVDKYQFKVISTLSM